MIAGRFYIQTRFGLTPVYDRYSVDITPIGYVCQDVYESVEHFGVPTKGIRRMMFRVLLKDREGYIHSSDIVKISRYGITQEQREMNLGLMLEDIKILENRIKDNMHQLAIGHD